MTAAGLPVVDGITPPAWTAPPALLAAMAELDMLFVSSARDLDTPIAPGALARGSGLRDVSLLTPQVLPFGRLVHVTTNFQATSSIERAMAILACGGLLAIKAHLLKRFGSYVALDGLDGPYAEYLDRLFTRIEDDYGDRVWWTTMGEIAGRMRRCAEPDGGGVVNAAAMACRPVAGAEAERRYLEALNVCFPAWGGREMFDWCFTRESAGLRPDLMTLHAGGGWWRASANTYRRIRLPNGETLVAGIMTGSWTLPESRGLGAFTRLIGESRDLAAARGAGLLLAFVTRTNGAPAGCGTRARRCFRPGIAGRLSEQQTDRIAADGGTFDDFDDDDARGDAEAEADGDAGHDAADDAHGTSDTNGGRLVRFVYEDDEWRDQFIQRPSGIMRVRGAVPTRAQQVRTRSWIARARGARWWSARRSSIACCRCHFRARVRTRQNRAGIRSAERRGRHHCGNVAAGQIAAEAPAAGDTVWLAAIATLAARASAAGRRLFCFTSEAHQASQLRDSGFEIVDGYLTALIANEAILRAACTAGGGSPPDMGRAAIRVVDVAGFDVTGAGGCRVAVVSRRLVRAQRRQDVSVMRQLFAAATERRTLAGTPSPRRRRECREPRPRPRRRSCPRRCGVRT